MNPSARVTAGLISRRSFVRNAGLVSAATVMAPRLWSAEPAPSPALKAVVIGHTGRGDFGHGLETIFNNRPGIQLVALADPDSAGREKTAARIGAPRQYADYREMLERERPNLVSLAMRHADQHHAIALAALRAGAHLYCEKPFTVSPEQSDDLLGEASRRNLKIAVAHTMRMTAPMVRLKQAIHEGLLGELVELRAYGKQDARAGGEDMMVLGSHLFDLMRMFAGDPLSCTARVLWQGRDIQAGDGRLVRDDVGAVAGDQVFASFAFSNGVNATFTSAAKLRETTGHWGIELLGSKGAARINCDIAPNIFIQRGEAWKPSGRTVQWLPLDPQQVKSAPPHNAGPVGDWLKSIQENREPECSGRNGAWAVEMVLGVYRAALQKAAVPFPLAQREHPLRLPG